MQARAHREYRYTYPRQGSSIISPALNSGTMAQSRCAPHWTLEQPESGVTHRGEREPDRPGRVAPNVFHLDHTATLLMRSDGAMLSSTRWPGLTTKPSVRVDLRDSRQWWSFARGAEWRHPRGASSTLAGLDDHAVVHVTYGDATAYATWTGKELPTDAEWELAARGRLDGAEYAWRDELTPGGYHLANPWQGEFPWQSDQDDGFEFTSPVDAFPPNVYACHLGFRRIIRGPCYEPPAPA